MKKSEWHSKHRYEVSEEIMKNKDEEKAKPKPIYLLWAFLFFVVLALLSGLESIGDLLIK